VLLRSFLYNEPSSAYVHGSTTSPSRSVVDEWIEAITPFYYSQRLFIMRILPPLFRAMASEQDPLFAIAQSILPNIIPDGRAFADTLLAEYAKKCTLDIPSDIASDPRAATRWAKQNYKEQLATLEVLFWTVWDYAPCDGPLVSRVLELSYEYNLGSKQRNATLLLDDESMQLQQDCAATWILITVEVLELEKIADPDGVLEISADPKTKDFYVSDPESLTKIHNLITSHRSTQYAITYLAWAFVLSRIVATAKTLKEIPDGYRTLFDTISTSSSGSSLFSKEREPVHMLMASTCLDPEVGLFKLMHSLLTTSPLFVTSIAIKTGSSIITPNVVASRSVFKGEDDTPLYIRQSN
jgi:nuclear pore complex protein Nup188